MQAQRPRRVVTKCVGELYPEGIYTRNRVMELIGIGADSIKDGIAAGVIKRHFASGHVYVTGADIIRWITEFGGRMPEPEAKPESLCIGFCSKPARGPRKGCASH